MTSPTWPRPCPWARMCTGVMVMIATIAIWVSTITVAPTTTPAPSAGAARSAGSVPARTATRASSCRATRNGSGRKNANNTAPAPRYAAAASRNGPDNGGRSTAVANLPSGTTRFGPATTPTVVATSATLTAVPRPPGSARSVPA